MHVIDIINTTKEKGPEKPIEQKKSGKNKKKTRQDKNKQNVIIKLKLTNLFFFLQNFNNIMIAFICKN